MLSPDLYFNDTIARYNLFKQAAVKLLQDVRLLSPEEIYHRCERLTEMYRELMENKEQLFIFIEFFGPGILDTAYIGDFQRALDKSIATCEALYQEIIAYRELLSSIDGSTTPATTDHFTSIPPGTTVQ